MKKEAIRFNNIAKAIKFEFHCLDTLFTIIASNEKNRNNDNNAMLDSKFVQQCRPLSQTPLLDLFFVQHVYIVAYNSTIYLLSLLVSQTDYI